MKNKRAFIIIELIIFILMGAITLLEFFSFDLFEKVFNLIQDPVSWLIGLSFGFVFSNLVKKIKTKTEKLSPVKDKGLFVVFLADLIIMALISAGVKELALSFFNNFFIYFQVLFLQWMMFLYLSFKAKNNYAISGKYLLTTELIILFYTIIVLAFIA
jgi:uncharacterized protein YacL